MHAAHKCITRLIVTGTRHHYAGWAWSCTYCVHSAQNAPRGGGGLELDMQHQTSSGTEGPGDTFLEESHTKLQLAVCSCRAALLQCPQHCRLVPLIHSTVGSTIPRQLLQLTEILLFHVLAIRI